MNFCKCGCHGITKEGKSFIHGHNGKGDKVRAAKISKKLKGRKPWNYGLTKENDDRIAMSREKASLSLKGHITSEETRRKISEANKGKQNAKGCKPWSTGLTKETDVRLLNRSNKMKAKKIKPWNYGLTKYTDERVLNYSKSMSKSKIGKPCNQVHGRGNAGVRKDLGNYYFRSSWEANFARLLNYFNIDWDYEPCRFVFDNSSLLVDFYLPKFDVWIEIKGFCDKRSSEKLAKMNSNFPDENVKILDREAYRFIKEKYSSQIAGWEQGSS